nr:hypothetical protein [Tanacetum cinerariifolium]
MTSFGYRLNPRYAIKECLSYGALYTRNFCCSKGSVEDKILIPKPPKNYARCAKCGHPVNGPYCQGCALLREKLEKDLVSKLKYFNDTSESSDDSTNVVNAPREPFIVKQDHGVKSSQKPPPIDECCCECGNALDGIFCQQCICKSCGKGAHIGYNCPPKCQPVNYCEPDPSYGSYYPGCDHFGDFYPQQYPCCENCRRPHETFQCQPTNEDYGYEQNSFYNSNSYGSDHCQPPQYTVDHPIFNAHNDLLKSQNELFTSQNMIMEQMTQLTSMCEMFCQIVQKKQEEKRIEEEQAASARYWKIPACCDDDDDYDSAITPILSTEETDNSLSMGDEHLDIIPATESNEVIKSSVEDLIPIPSEFEGIPDTMCDVHLDNNHTPLEAKNHFETVINSKDDISSSDDDSLHEENIEYVEASPHDSELVSLEVAEIVTSEVEEIEDDNLREKLLNVHLLIANIEALKDNPTPSSELLTQSSSTSLNSFLEETNTFHNSLPEFENFYFDLGEISSGSTTTHFDISLSKYDSFIFDLTHEEFVDELAHIISPPDVNLPIEDDHSPLLAYVVWIFVDYLTYPVIPPYLHPFGNEDTIFDPGITINHFYSFKPGLFHRHGAFKKFNTHHSHLNKWPMTINGKNTPILDVFLFHFYLP